MPQQSYKRIIGRYNGSPGPLLIVLGAIHGNEPAGVKAIEFIIKMLEVEPITNPDFKFFGTITGILGNRAAFRQKQRFLDVDLNRIWKSEIIERVISSEKTLSHEESELKEILVTIQKEIKKSKPSEVYIIDIHTTSSDGGIFVIPGDEDKSLKIALSTNAPVILGMLEGIHGTTMHYLNTETLHVNTHSITFEAGQHSDPLSVNRSIAAIINVMKSQDMVKKKDVEHIHDQILKKYSKNLPSTSRLLYKHSIPEGAVFEMKAGYKNFQTIKKGEELATQDGKSVLSPFSGNILMPLYQKRGQEGFFIIEPIS